MSETAILSHHGAHSFLLFIFLCFLTDVCQTVCGWEPGPDGANLQAAQGQDPGHPRCLWSAISGIPRTRTEENPNIPQVMSAHAQVQRWLGICKFFKMFFKFNRFFIIQNSCFVLIKMPSNIQEDISPQGQLHIWLLLHVPITFTGLSAEWDH